MAFVVDDLLAWLVGLLADAGRKKLTELVLGTDQERSLRRAAEAAVEATAAELASSDEQAERLAMAVGEVFRGPLEAARRCRGSRYGCRRGLRCWPAGRSYSPIWTPGWRATVIRGPGW